MKTYIIDRVPGIELGLTGLAAGTCTCEPHESTKGTGASRF